MAFLSVTAALPPRASVMPDAAEQQFDGIAVRFVELLKQNVPVDTGETRQSIRVTGRAPLARTITISGAAVFLIEGTAPHDIVAAPGSVLAFKWHGRQVFVHSVHHPGTRPNDFVERAAGQLRLDLAAGDLARALVDAQLGSS